MLIGSANSMIKIDRLKEALTTSQYKALERAIQSQYDEPIAHVMERIEFDSSYNSSDGRASEFIVNSIFWSRTKEGY